MVKYQLYYFDAQGAAEVIRLSFVLGGIEFEDIRLSREEFAQKKAEGFFKFSQVPVLIIDGQYQLAQSQPIAKYIAKLGGFHPTDPLEEFKIDEALALNQDVQAKLRPSMYEENVEKKAAMRKELAEITLPQWTQYAEKLLATNGTGFFSGNYITVADLSWFVQIGYIKSGYFDGIPTNLVDQFPLLSKLYETIEGNEKISSWNKAHQNK